MRREAEVEHEVERYPGELRKLREALRAATKVLILDRDCLYESTSLAEADALINQCREALGEKAAR